MSDIERNVDLYLSFVGQQDWLNETLTNMTFAEFNSFVDYMMAEINLYAESKEGAEFFRVKGLILAVARKMLEMGRFAHGITDQQREVSIRTATTFYELAKGFYRPEDVSAVEAAWAGSLDYCSKFGWPSPVFLALAPRQIFKDID